MKVIFILLTCLLSLQCFSTEMIGFLSVEEKVDVIKVGEAYNFKLILVPYDKTSLKPSELKGKFLLDIIYINNIISAEPSTNNTDAMVVNFVGTLVKKSDFQSLMIWSYEDLNIPVEIKISNVEDTQLISKKFQFFERPFDFSGGLKWWYYLIFLTILILGALLIYYGVYLGRKKSKKAIYEFDVIGHLRNIQGHKDLEQLYKHRREVILLAQNKGREKEVRSFYDAYSNLQFKPDWKEISIEDFKLEAKEIAEGLVNGV